MDSLDHEAVMKSLWAIN